MKRTTVDGIVIACMFVALYVNLTDLPKHSREVRGTLIRIGTE
jgi:hypothetical protein